MSLSITVIIQSIIVFVTSLSINSTVKDIIDQQYPKDKYKGSLIYTATVILFAILAIWIINYIDGNIIKLN